MQRRSTELPVEQQRHQTAAYHGYDHVRDAWQPDFHRDTDQQGQYRHRGRGRIDIGRMGTELNQDVMEVSATVHLHPKEVFQLLGGDQQGRTSGETDHHRVGDEVDQRPHAGKTEQQFEHPHHEGQGQGQGHIIGTARRGQQGQCGKQYHRSRGGGT